MGKWLGDLITQHSTLDGGISCGSNRLYDCEFPFDRRVGLIQGLRFTMKKQGHLTFLNR